MAKYSKFTIEYINLKKPIESKLTAIRLAGHTNAKTPVRLVTCKCLCGKETTISVYDVASGRTLSCGCHANFLTGLRSKKYFPSNKHIYDSYRGMIRRCYDEKDQAYKNYGQRGVVVCEEWRNSYQAFLDWSLLNGWQFGMQIDKDIKGNGMLYGPDTCTWATPEENANHKRGIPKFDFNGKQYTIAQISRLTGIKAKLLYRRITNYRWSIEKAISKPNRCQKFADKQKP